MAVVLAEIELNERDGQLYVDKYLYNNSYPDYSEESYYHQKKTYHLKSGLKTLLLLSGKSWPITQSSISLI